MFLEIEKASFHPVAAASVLLSVFRIGEEASGSPAEPIEVVKAPFQSDETDRPHPDAICRKQPCDTPTAADGLP